uniref:Aryl hydrocarbon receptor nuclear translocator n=1 Tax=Phallusia mammillata TaxID=59560 RepID=A0A6F9D7M4_9ASCI|nr:aryl hydrocarbon receptor nuclear translocator [Phallusia mammillata]
MMSLRKSIEDMSQKEKEKFARENHSEIERRRRNKMTAYITELSDMVPTCSALARKPDKLTILRMAVSHMKNLRGAMAGGMENNFKPSFLTDQELKHLVLEAADGFLFVTACDSSQVVYVSDTVTAVLNQAHAEWNGHLLYDLIHPDDVGKVREQLCISESQNSGRVLDLKTGTVKKEGQQSSVRMCMGSRRAFICRMRVGKHQMNMARPRYMRAQNTLGQPEDGKDSYVVMHVTGFIRAWPPAGYGSEADAMDEVSLAAGNNSGNYCLVAVARLQITSHPGVGEINSSQEATEFVSRHGRDGAFTFVDLRVTGVLGYQPQDLLTKMPSDFYHPEDIEHMKESFKQVLLLKGQVLTMSYRFRAQSGEYAWLRTSSFSFQNPYNNEVEYVVCTNTLVKQPGSDQHQVEVPNAAVPAEIKSMPTYAHTPTEQSPQVMQQYPMAQVAVKSPVTEMDYSPQQQFNSPTQAGWNHGAAVPATVSPYQPQPTVSERFAPNLGAQHNAGSVPYSSGSYQTTPPVMYPVSAAHHPIRDAYQQQEAMATMMEPGAAAYTQADYNNLGMYSSYSES